MNKKIIFIDWDGTLCFSRFWETLSAKNPSFGQIVADFFAKEKELIKNWMRGKNTSEEINKLLSERAGLPEKEVWKSFITDCQNMQFNAETIKLIQELRKKYIIILITGNMDCFSRFTVPSLKLKDLFDYVVNSYDTGILKTDDNGKQFFDCLTLFNSKISDAYLIEDSANTCEVFSKLGGKALKVDRKEDTLTHLNKFLEKI